MTIADGSQVSLEYELSLDDGTVIDGNAGQDPLTYTHGAGQLIPGLERELLGLKSGDSKDVTVAPADGYGEVQEDAFKEVPTEMIPEDARKPDARLQGTGEGGETVNVRVAEIRESAILLDFNHPLAGHTLHFKVKVLNVAE